MKIAIITTDYFPTYTGASVRVDGIAEGLIKSGNKVIIITFKNIKEVIKELINGIIVYKIPFKKYIVSGKVEKYLKFHPGRYLSLRKHIKNIIKNENIELVHVRPQLDFGFIGLYIKRKYGLPLIIEMHRFFSEVDYESKEISRINAIIINLMEKYILNKADYMVVLTQTAKNDFIKSGIKIPIIIVPNASNLKNNLKIKKNINKKYLIYFGMLRKNERIENLIYAFKEIKEKVRGIKLYICGYGEEEEYLRNLIKKLSLESSINFFGKVPIEKLKELLAGALLFVHPRENIKYHTNFIGLKIYDAINFGLPIVTYDVGETAEFIKSKKIGLVTKPTPSAFASSVIKILEDKKLYDFLKRNAIKESKKIDWNDCTIGLHKVYKSLVKT